MPRRSIMRKAFTLVELIIVVIIIGILAAIAVPQYNKTMERSRISEASAVLGALRGAQLRYKLENTNYASDPDNLDIDMPSYGGITGDGKFFSYSVGSEWINSATGTAVATATRKSSSQYGQYVIKIGDQGVTYCASSDCAGFVSQ